jgi:LacI family transcriptional regulator, galactose operon repressor
MAQVTRLKDIAVAAEVSMPVVSDILNNKGKRFRPETREKIWRLAQEMNYNPAFSGRSLATGKSYNIGLLMPTRYGTALSLHHLNIFHGLCLAVERTDYNLVTFFGGGEKYFRKLKQGRLDGIIILQSYPDYGDINRTLQAGLPTVVVNLDYDVTNSKNVACVRSDHESMMRECFKRFVESGCKRIISVNNYSLCDPNIIIYEEFNRQCAAYSSSGIFGSTFSSSEQFTAQIRNMLASGQRWDGYLVDGTEYADELLTVAREFNLEQNRDFQLFVSDTNTLRMKFDYPCYLHSQREMGRTAWSLLQKMIAGEKLKEKKVLIKYRPAEELQTEARFDIDVKWEKLNTN